MRVHLSKRSLIFRLNDLVASILIILFTVGFPGCHLAGQTSPCLSENWNAFKSLSISSTFLPIGASFTDECLSIPLSSIKNVPLNATPFNPSLSLWTST